MNPEGGNNGGNDNDSGFGRLMPSNLFRGLLGVDAIMNPPNDRGRSRGQVRPNSLHRRRHIEEAEDAAGGNNEPTEENRRNLVRRGVHRYNSRYDSADDGDGAAAAAEPPLNGVLAEFNAENIQQDVNNNGRIARGAVRRNNNNGLLNAEHMQQDVNNNGRIARGAVRRNNNNGLLNAEHIQQDVNTNGRIARTARTSRLPGYMQHHRYANGYRRQHNRPRAPLQRVRDATTQYNNHLPPYENANGQINNLLDFRNFEPVLPGMELNGAQPQQQPLINFRASRDYRRAQRVAQRVVQRSIQATRNNIAPIPANGVLATHPEDNLNNDNAVRPVNNPANVGGEITNSSTTREGGADPATTSSNESARTTSKARILKELQEIMSNPPPNCSAGPKEDNIYQWTATILGPQGTVYEDGVFSLDITFPKDYPFEAPGIRFRTMIYHCNISRNGLICLDILKNNWSPALSISGVLLSISSLLTDCNPYDPLVAEIAKEYLEDREKYNRTAKQWTRLYAQT